MRAKIVIEIDTSVDVASLGAAERYARVHHLVSKAIDLIPVMLHSNGATDTSVAVDFCQCESITHERRGCFLKHPCGAWAMLGDHEEYCSLRVPHEKHSCDHPFRVGETLSWYGSGRDIKAEYDL